MLTEPTVFDTLRFRLQGGMEYATRNLVNDFRLKDIIQEEFKFLRLGYQEGLVETKNELKEMIMSIRGSKRPTRQRTSSSVEEEQEEDARSISASSEMDLRRQQIRNYEDCIRSETFINDLNHCLHRSLPSATTMIQYYQNKSELQQYTMEKELRRMNYTVWTHTGKKLTTPKDITEYYYESMDNTTTAAGTQNQNLLWRAANQSMLGDVICCLTSPTGLIRPQINGGTFVNDCSITIDMSTVDQPFVQAECFLNVSIPTTTNTSSGTTSSRATSTTSGDGERDGMSERVGEEDEGRQSIAGAVISVYFCPGKRSFKAKVWHVSYGERLTENELGDAARAM